ncbi:MAG: PAS domain S-box protein [Candidatus Aminicenantes bacterium]|nr:PAS domain S-box protein [Candidatus Aminicenantes bacterium]
MKDQGKSTRQLMNELEKLRLQNAELEKSEIKHRQVEELLQENQERYKAFFDRSLCCVYVHDLEGRFLDVNKAASNLLKYTKKDLASLSLFSLIEKDQLPDATRTFEEIKRTGSQKKHSEYQLRKKDGNYAWVETEASVIYRDGKPYAIQSIGRDITKRKQAEEELKSSEEVLKILFEFAPDAYVVIDMDGKFVDCNKAAEKLTGYKKKELLGNSFLKLKLLPPDQIPKAVNGLAKVTKGKIRPPVEYSLRRKDGSHANAHISTYPVKIRGRTLATAIARDITERKKADEARKQFASSLAFLSRTAMEFVELPFGSDIYKFIGKRLRELVGNSFVLVNSFDETTQCIQVQAFLGARKEIESVLKILKKDLIEISFPISEEARAGLSSGKLVKVPGGLYVLSFEKIPKNICTILEKILNLRDIYVMGFTRKGKLFGNAVIITRSRAGLEKKDLIETFVGQASVALQRRRAEEELIKYREHLEEMVEERTTEIKAANERLKQEIAERKNVERALLGSEAKLQKQKSALEQKNVALREVIAQIEVEKRRIKEDIENNINIAVSPILEKLKIEKPAPKYVNLIQHHLNELTSSFSSKITKKSLKLTPREIEVCNMVKGGLKSKDISNLLNISYRTVEKHRKNIRQKLEISNKRINLTSFLREF